MLKQKEKKTDLFLSVRPVCTAILLETKGDWSGVKRVQGGWTSRRPRRGDRRAQGLPWELCNVEVNLPLAHFALFFFNTN